MKKQLEIIKMFGLLLMFFILVSAIAVGEEPIVSVTIKISSSSGDDGDTITNAYADESGSTSTHVECGISGNSHWVITDGEGATKDDTTATENTDSAAMPDLQIGESTPEEISAELSKWISSLIEEELSLTMTDDFL